MIAEGLASAFCAEAAHIKSIIKHRHFRRVRLRRAVNEVERRSVLGSRLVVDALHCSRVDQKAIGHVVAARGQEASAEIICQIRGCSRRWRVVAHWCMVRGRAFLLDVALARLALDGTTSSPFGLRYSRFGVDSVSLLSADAGHSCPEARVSHPSGMAVGDRLE